ncbi:unnamed protein product [marine sediment metagenome]|uniref:Uncharacterized protein n=1 Tax=marine sediment metagenome TaxID=412755 RepID=X0WTQ8_9ZZZZ
MAKKSLKGKIRMETFENKIKEIFQFFRTFPGILSKLLDDLDSLEAGIHNKLKEKRNDRMRLIRDLRKIRGVIKKTIKNPLLEKSLDFSGEHQVTIANDRIDKLNTLMEKYNYDTYSEAINVLIDESFIPIEENMLREEEESAQNE